MDYHNQIYTNTSSPEGAGVGVGVGQGDQDEHSNFQFSELLEFGDEWNSEQEEQFMNMNMNMNMVEYSAVPPPSSAAQIVTETGRSGGGDREGGRGSAGSRREGREKVAFKTKSEVEILDDGFKWRKYGKKMVKNSPNPRNYYRCSVENCPVKKRVEREKEDPRYVITTYEGIHNHQGPQL